MDVTEKANAPRRMRSLGKTVVDMSDKGFLNELDSSGPVTKLFFSLLMAGGATGAVVLPFDGDPPGRVVGLVFVVFCAICLHVIFRTLGRRRRTSPPDTLVPQLAGEAVDPTATVSQDRPSLPVLDAVTATPATLSEDTKSAATTGAVATDCEDPGLPHLVATELDTSRQRKTAPERMVANSTDGADVGSALAPTAAKTAREATTNDSALGWIVILTAVGGPLWWWSPWENKQEAINGGAAPHIAHSQRDDGRIRAALSAKQMVEDRLKAPATAQWGEPVVTEESHPNYLVHVVVDAQNSFGALIRNSFLVALELREGDEFTYHPNAAVQKCSDPPTDLEIAATKGLNGWLPREAETPGSDNTGSAGESRTSDDPPQAADEKLPLGLSRDLGRALQRGQCFELFDTRAEVGRGGSGELPRGEYKRFGCRDPQGIEVEWTMRMDAGHEAEIYMVIVTVPRRRLLSRALRYVNVLSPVDARKKWRTVKRRLRDIPMTIVESGSHKLIAGVNQAGPRAGALTLILTAEDGA